jgi:urease accessory protein
MRKLPLIVLATLFPTVAFAHTGAGETSGLLLGLAHPFAGLDHIITMVAVGVLAVVVGGHARCLLPLSFIAMMVVGFLLGRMGVDVPLVELGIALSGIAIGGAAALGRQIPVAAAMALVGVFAIFHGHAHGSEMSAGANGLQYALGFVVATALLHLAGVAGAIGLNQAVGRYGRPAARVLGGTLSLGAVFLLAWF